MTNLGHAIDLIQSFKPVAADRNVSDRRRFDLGQVTEQVVKGLRFGLRSQNLDVSVASEPNLAINSFPGRFGQVLTTIWFSIPQGTLFPTAQVDRRDQGITGPDCTSSTTP